MKKVVFVAFALAGLMLHEASGAHLDADAALARALSDNGRNPVCSRGGAAPGNYVLAASVVREQSPGNNMYVFNREGGDGYIVVPNDDKFVPVLAYADKGTFDWGNVPSGMLYWLEMYASEMKSCEDLSSVNNLWKGASSEDVNIEPLLTCKWGQDNPYNRFCPLYWPDGAGAPPMHSPTGCVATAMAQIMYYHKWPGNALGETFDWDSMLPEYVYDDYTDTQADAVALLMSTIGKAVSMDYGWGSSSANSHNALKAFFEDFAYDRGTLRVLSRDYVPLRDVNDALIKDLTEGRPVFVCANSKSGAHAFVLDGCAGAGYYHINWGWNGVSNGYFRLSALDPSIQGTGGSNGAYNYGQMFFTGIQKVIPEGEVYGGDDYELVAGGDIVYVGRSWCTENNAYPFGGFMNRSRDNEDFQLGCQWVNRANREATVVWDKRVNLPRGSYIGPLGYLYGGYWSDMPNGEYDVYLVYRTSDNGMMKRVVAPLGMSQSVKVIITDDNTEVINEPKESGISVSGVSMPEVVHQGDVFDLMFGVSNNDEDYYHGDIDVVLTSAASGDELYLGSVMSDLQPGEAETTGSTINISLEVERGNYYLQFKDLRGKHVGKSDVFSITNPDPTKMVALIEENFPDPLFREYIRDMFDYNDDGYLSDSERASAKDYSRGISNPSGQEWLSIKGVEFFPELLQLYCRGCRLGEVDLSGLPNLESLGLVDCHVKSLRLGMKPKLRGLDISGNDITEADFSDMSALESLSINSSKIVSIVLENNPKLESFYFACGIDDDRVMENMKIHNCDALKTVAGPRNMLSEVDIKNCHSIEVLWLSDNQLEEIILSGVPNVKVLKLNNNPLKTLDVSCNEKLESLTIDGTCLTSLDLSRNTELKELYWYARLDVYTDADYMFDLNNLREYGFEFENFVAEGTCEWYLDETKTKLDFTYLNEIAYDYKHNSPNSSVIGETVRCYLRSLGVDPDAGVCDVAADKHPGVHVGKGYIEFHGISDSDEVRLLNAAGQCVYCGYAKIVENLSPGIYIAKVAGKVLKVSVL